MATTRQLDLLQAHREQILQLAARTGMVNVRVFGSVARGDQREDSDIDLMVDVDEEAALFDYFEFWDEVEDLLGIKVDVVIEDVSNPKMSRALAEAIPL